MATVQRAKGAVQLSKDGVSGPPTASRAKGAVQIIGTDTTSTFTAARLGAYGGPRAWMEHTTPPAAAGGLPAGSLALLGVGA